MEDELDSNVEVEAVSSLALGSPANGEHQTAAGRRASRTQRRILVAVQDWSASCIGGRSWLAAR